jgi:transposase
MMLLTGSAKKITRAYKKTLTAAQRKAFRSQLWAFRRDPADLTDEERTGLEELFQELPRLRTLYAFRQRFKGIFDTAKGRRRALYELTGLFVDMVAESPALDAFLRTFERWQEEILNYFEARQTSGPVEGINNKARVIVKRCYGLRSADSLWTRLILDLNRAAEVVVHTIGQVKGLVAGFRALFSTACT